MPLWRQRDAAMCGGNAMVSCEEVNVLRVGELAQAEVPFWKDSKAVVWRFICQKCQDKVFLLSEFQSILILSCFHPYGAI